MTNFDYRVVDAIGGDPNRLRARLAKVISVEFDRTMTVQLAGTTENISGVSYMSSARPKPGSGIWILTDGRDLFGIDTIASADRTIAPRANRSTDQNIANATDVAIIFDQVNGDPWGAWSPTNPTRLTAPLTGRYIAVASLGFAANATGFRRAFVQRNGTTLITEQNVAPAAAGTQTHIQITSQPFDMTAGTEWIELYARQSSGGTLAATTQSTFSPALSLIYLGP